MDHFLQLNPAGVTGSHRQEVGFLISTTTLNPSAHVLFKIAIKTLIIHCESLPPFSSSDLIQATQESNVNIPQMADTLFERAGNASWIVVFKALVTTHHLMVHGNEVRLAALHSVH